MERTIALTGVPGRLDHLSVDLARHRLFVAEVGNDAVDVIDLPSGKAIHRIGRLDEPQGVAYSRAGDLLFVANGGDGTVRMFGGEDFREAGAIALGSDADNIHIGSDSRVYVGYGDGGIAIIDPLKRARIGGIALASHPEGFQIAPSGRIFVNLPDAREIAVGDAESGKVLARWKLSARANFPMAIDAAGTQIATIFRGPARLLLMDAKTGKEIAGLESCGDADDVFFDPNRPRLYVSCGDGFLDVIARDPGGLRRLARIPTSAGARTSLFVPELDRLFVAMRARLLGSDAQIRVYRPGD